MMASQPDPRPLQSSLSPPLPAFGISTAVVAGHDDDSCLVESEIETVGEALEENSPGVAVQQGTGERHGRQEVLGVLERSEELLPEPWPLLLVPEIGRSNVSAGSPLVDDLEK